MAYRITAFGGVTITPTGLDVGRGEIRGPYTATISGVYDSLGTNRAKQDLPRPLSVRAQVEATSAAALKTAWDAVLALHGTSGTLTRTSDSAVAHTISARCRRIQADRTPHDRFRIPYIIEFDLLADVWDGASGTVDGVLDDVPESITVANDGNVRVDDAVITITAAGSAITELTVAVAGVSSFTWTGTLAVGKDLVIDCGARTVQNDGADAYSGFELDAGHVVAEWLRLSPGNNTVVITRTGGDATSAYEIAFTDGWA